MRWTVLMLLLAACPTNGARPTPTGAVCPDVQNPQFTWENFGHDFMFKYCTNCHNSALEGPRLRERNGAPAFHDFDTYIGVMEVPDHIDQQTGFGPKAK